MKRTLGILMAFCIAAAAGAGASAQVRQSSVSLSIGAYAASGISTNPFVGAHYNYTLPGGRFFVEAGLGYTSLKSDVLASVSRAEIFSSDDLFTYEFLAAYDPMPSGYFPYIAAGVAGVNQGGQANIAAVFGLGKHLPLGSFLGDSQCGLRYDVRDQMFSQSIVSNETFLAHNLLFTIGFEVFF
jgi:hypothetical protein